MRISALSSFFICLPLAAEAHHRFGRAEMDPHWHLLLFTGLALLLLLEVAVLRRRQASWERLWTAAPFAFLLVIMVSGLSLRIAAAPRQIPKDAMVVEAVARQFQWEFRYPGSSTSERTELHVPLGRDVVVRIKSADVLHSFDVPQLRLHQDVVPQTARDVLIRVDREGRYDIVCTALCGSGTDEMPAVLVAEDSAKFDDWMRSSGKLSATK